MRSAERVDGFVYDREASPIRRRSAPGLVPVGRGSSPVDTAFVNRLPEDADPDGSGSGGRRVGPETPFVLVHVGKCGGTSAVEELRERGYRCEHVHLRRPEVDPGRRYVILVRDPIARTVSAFNWRRRLFAAGTLSAAGADPVARLRHAAEHDFLSRFANVNEFAERLEFLAGHEISPMVTMMQLIGHVPHGFAWHLDGLLRRIEPRQLAGIVATERFAEDFERVFGFPPVARRNRHDGGDSTVLSARGRENLARVLAPEYETLAALAELAESAGVPMSVSYRRPPLARDQ